MYCRSGILAVLFFLVFTRWANAQQEEPPAGILKFSLFSLFDAFQPYLSFASEFPLGMRRSVTVEAGLAMPLKITDAYPLYTINSGFRLRPGLRFYKPGFIIDGKGGTFWELHLGYEYFNANIAGDFCRDNCSFLQRFRYNMRQHNLSFGGVGGFQRSFARRLTMELGMGASIQSRFQRFGGVPPDAEFRTNGALRWSYSHEPVQRPGFRLLLYGRIGYLLR